MNQMTQALATAGINVPPVNKRVWLWLKDHPEKTYEEVAKALGIRENQVSQALTDMKARGMLKVYREPNRNKGRGTQMVSRYTCMFNTFELTPKQKAKPVLVHKASVQPVAAPKPVNTNAALIKKAQERFEQQHGFLPTTDQIITAALKEYLK